MANWAVKRQPGAPMAQATVTLPASFSEEIERTSLFRQAKSIGLELLGESAQNSVGRPSKQRAAKLRAIDDAATYLAWPTKRVSYTWHIASMAEMRAKLPRNFIEAYMRAFLRTILGVAVAPVARPDAGAGAAAAAPDAAGADAGAAGVDAYVAVNRALYDSDEAPVPAAAAAEEEEEEEDGDDKRFVHDYGEALHLILRSHAHTWGKDHTHAG